MHSLTKTIDGRNRQMKKILSLVACLALLASLVVGACAENVVVEAVPNEG